MALCGLDVAAEVGREVEQETALRRQGVGVAGVEFERPREVLVQSRELPEVAGGRFSALVEETTTARSEEQEVALSAMSGASVTSDSARRSTFR